MLHIVTIATDKSKVQDLLASAAVYNTPIEVIYLQSWNGYIDKIKAMKEALHTYKSDDIICFIDAYDVLCTASAEKIMKAYTALNAPLIFSTELNCFPPHLQERYNSLPNGPTKSKYVNSGGYMGRCDAITEFLNWKPIEEITRISEVGGDQTYFAEYYLSNPHKVALDYKQEIFQNMFFVGWSELVFVNSRVYNKTLQTSPCFLHFNGQSHGSIRKPNIMPDVVDILVKGKICEMSTLNQGVCSWYYPRPQL